MNLSRSIVVVAVSFVLLAGCASHSLWPDDVRQTCSIRVDEKAGGPRFAPNPLSNAGGALAGAGGGALSGLYAGGAAIVVSPVLAVLGAGIGAACAAAAADHPNADADFQHILAEADTGIFKRTLEARLNAPRAACESAAAHTSAPDVVVEIERSNIGMGCLYGEQTTMFVVHWRAVHAKTGRVLAWNVGQCRLTSARSVDAWFSDQAYARSEIERLLARAGGTLSDEILGQSPYASSYTCQFRAREDGELEAQ